MKKVLFIIGSLRKNGFNYQLSKEAEALIKNKYDVSYLDYSNIPYMNQDIENPVPENIGDIRKHVIESDLVFIFTPEYNYSYPGVLKNLLDWLSRPLIPNDFNSGTAVINKKVVVTGIGGKNKTNDARNKLIDLLKFMKMDVLDYSVGFQVNDDAWMTNKVTLADEQINELKTLLNNVYEFLDRKNA